MAESPAKSKKDKIKAFFKDNNNVILVLILALAFFIRLYYFVLTKGQPLWWDESDYLAYAKNLAGFPVDWIVTEKHNSLYPFLAAAIMSVGLKEVAMKFILQLVPSILSVFLVYLIAASMYKDKRIALISAFLFSVFWVHLFHTMRFHLDIPAFLFGLLSIYVFWEGYEKGNKIFGKIDPKWALPLTAVLLILTYSLRRGYLLFVPFFVLYVLLTGNWKTMVKNKYNWVALGIGAALFFLIEKTIFYSGIEAVGGAYFHEELPITFLPLQVFAVYFKMGGFIQNLWFYLFVIGFFVLVGNIVLSGKQIRNKEDKETRADLFNILTIILTLAFFILVLRAQNAFGEDRWFFPLLLGSFICISKSSLFMADLVKKYNKHLAIIFLLLVLLIGGFYQLKQAGATINNKIGSYQGIKEAGLLVNQMSSEQDIVIVRPRPQAAYYSERKVTQPRDMISWEGENEDVPFEPVLEKIRENPNMKYLIVTFSEPGHPSWMQSAQYAQVNGQVVPAIWEIPFMDTKINFATGEQDIKKSKTYGDITFNLIDVKQDAFIYQITRP